MEIRVLLIEDNQADARLVLEMLKEVGGDRFVVDRADRLSTAVEKLSAQAADAVLLDLTLPDSEGLDTFSQIHSRFSEIPIVVLTGLSNEEGGVQAVRAGAQDYLVKGVISGTALSRVLRYGIERKRVEEALRASERRYRLLFEHNMAAVLRTVGDGHIVDANESCARMLGYASREELLQRQVWELWYKPEDRPAFIARLQKERALSGIELCFRRKDGTPVVALASVTLNGGNTSEAAVIEGTLIDISDRKQAEEERKRLVTAIEQCAETIIITDPKGTMQYVNPTFTKVTGYSREEAVGRNPRLLKSDKHDASFFEGFWNTLLAGEPWHGEMINRRKDGTLYTDELHVAPVRDPEGKLVHFISNQLDVTDRKRAEGENLRLATAIEQAAEGVMITDLKARIQYVNPAFTKITGYNSAEALGQNPRLLKSGKHDLKFYEEMWTSILSGKTWHGEIINRRRDGTLYTEEMTITPVRDAGGVITSFIAIKQDVTDRKQQEELIRASLREKEMFLKEIHHRVKNKLQVISSLLQLRAGAIRDEEVLDVFRQSQTRVRTMALIHEKLYRSKDFARIDFSEYTVSLVTDLFHSYQVNPEAVSFAVSGDQLLLGLDKAIPCALIMNELVSNSLKHAFPRGPGGNVGFLPATVLADSPGQRGLITLALTASGDGKARLVVRDNGRGFPGSVDFRHTQSLGLQLVNALTEQLNGTVQMRADGGTEFQIEFSTQD